MSKKVQFSMMVTETQKEIMDFVVDIIEGGKYSKAQFTMEHFIDYAKGYCGMPDGYNLSPKMLLSSLKEAKKRKDSVMVGVIGIENYRKFISESIENGTFSEEDIVYHHSLVELHILNTTDKKEID